MGGPTVIIVDESLFFDAARGAELAQFLKFLKTQLKTVVFFENILTIDPLDSATTKFNFKQPVLYKREDKTAAVIVHVFGKKLGEGGDGTVVYDIAKSVELTPDLEFIQGGGYTQPQPPRVLKVQQQKRKRFIQSEYEKSQRVEHLGMQEPMVDSGDRSFIVMNKLPGQELFQIISDSP